MNLALPIKQLRNGRKRLPAMRKSCIFVKRLLINMVLPLPPIILVKYWSPNTSMLRLNRG